jgi:hypothetical protein
MNASDKTLSASQVNKKANWVTVSLPRSLVRDLRATADALGISVVQVVERAYKNLKVANPAPAPEAVPTTPEAATVTPEAPRPDAVQVGRFVYPKKG